MLDSLRTTTAAVCFTVLAAVAMPSASMAESAAGLREDAQEALKVLYRHNEQAKMLGEKARSILVFPNIVKAGFIVGGQYGEGVRYKGGAVTGYYSSVAASYGLQAGVQGYGYAMFLMTPKAEEYVDKSEGWEIGAGPSVVVVDAGVGKNLTSTTLRDDVYAFIFDQKGLMAGIGIQGSKITKISK